MTDKSNDKHQQRQQKVKEQVDARVAAAQDVKGIFQVITGNGKGKSTSGFGVVARCVGHGKKPQYVSLLKVRGNVASVTYCKVQALNLQ